MQVKILNKKYILQQILLIMLETIADNSILHKFALHIIAFRQIVEIHSVCPKAVILNKL